MTTTDTTATAPATTTATELRAAAAKIRETVRGTADGPWNAAPVWSPDSASTSAVYSHAYPTGTVESEVVASGQKRYRKGGLRNPCNARWIALMNPLLAEPLAAWLTDTATWWDNTTAYGPEGDELYHATPECGHEAATCGCFHRALAVARAINGGAA